MTQTPIFCAYGGQFCITLFGSMTMLCGTDSIPRDSECGEYPRILCEILSVPHNIVMDMNYVM